jgi:hypothetical protein
MATLQESTIDTLTAGRGNNTVVTNTAFGSQALKLNSSGTYNVAIGINALTSNTTGGGNTAVGAYAADAVNSGFQNTSVGFNSHTALTTGRSNTAIGQATLGAQTTSQYITALGAQAGRCNTTSGNSAVFIGWRSGFSSTAGVTLVGVKAGYSLTTRGAMAAVGYCAISVSNPGNNWGVAIGTCALRQLTAGYLVGVGFCAGGSNTSGTSNVFIGSNAGKNNGVNTSQHFVGAQAGCCSSTNRGSFVGTNAGLVSTGYAPNALGADAAINNTNLCQSLAIGYKAGIGNTNTARTIHVGACTQTCTGRSLVIGGSNSGGACGDNTIVGFCTGKSLTTGDNNVLIGAYAGCAITTGRGNNIIGYKAGQGITTCFDSIIIGNQAQASHNQVVFAIGAYAQTSNNNGHTVWGTAYNNKCNCIQLQWSTPSDCRDKTHIEPLNPKLGLQFVNKIRPVSFNWDNRDLYVKKCGFEYGEKDGTLARDKERYGIIAQEVLQILDDLDVKWDGVKGTEKAWRVGYDHFFASLVTALQELSHEIDNIEEQILQLEK